MPYPTRKSRLFLCKETATYGTAASGATGTMLGALNGPLAGLMTATLGAQASTPGCVMPMLGASQLQAMQEKHVSAAQVGRRFEDVDMVLARRSGGGQFQVEVMPDTFGLLLVLAMGADSVTATASGTTTGTNSANATTLNVATGLPALSNGQRIWINDGALSEYVTVNGNQGANTLAIPINGGSGTGGGLKNTHNASTPVQVGPWTHVITASNPIGAQAEDNYGGHASSFLYQGGIIDGIDIEAPIENPTDSVKATVKWLSKAPSATVVAASAAGTTGPSEEESLAAGNAPTFTFTGAADATVYVADFKAQLANNAKLAAASASSPDPYGAIGTALSLRGSMETAFEDYGVAQDQMGNVIWSPATFLWTWPQQRLPAGGAGAAVAATLQLQVQRMGLEKLGKQTDKSGLLHLPIDAWRALDNPDFTNPFTFTLKNGVAVY
jgi:hypothetical protein